MRRKSILATIAVAAAVFSTAAARAPFVASQRTEIPAGEVRLPGAIVLASQPTLNEILDIILGDVAPAGETANTPQARIATMLSKRTNPAMAERIARALVREGRRASLEPSLLVGVLLTENPDLAPRATSSVGARGLMQVMPFHAGNWGCESTDLFDIDANICHGVRILADNLRHSPDLPTALLRYNGCMRGTVTPDCHAYAARVYAFARRNPIVRFETNIGTPFSSLRAPQPSRTNATQKPKKAIVIPRELLVE